MAKQWSVFFGLALVVALARDGFADPSTAPSASSSTSSSTRCSIEIERKDGLVVGDAVAYRLGGCSAGLEIAPASSLYELGISPRSGKILVVVKDGELSLPELDVIDTKSQALVAKTDPITLKVQTSIQGQGEEASKPAPPIGYVLLGLPSWIQMAIIFVLLGLAGILIFFVVRWLKNKAKRIVNAVLPKKPYDVLAIERLQKLLDQGHLRKSEWKPFAFGVSETMKFYLGNRYGFDAQESTTSELFERLEALKNTIAQGPQPQVIQTLKSAYEALDIVKFTDQAPTVDSMMAVWKSCKQVIDTTRIQKVEPILSEERLKDKKAPGVEA